MEGLICATADGMRRERYKEQKIEEGGGRKRRGKVEIEETSLAHRAVLRARVSRNSCGAGTDISQKMNHPYTNEPTHRGNSGTIVRQ